MGENAWERASDLKGMRVLAPLSAVFVLALGCATNAFALPKKPSRAHRTGNTHAAQKALHRATSQLVKAADFRRHVARPSGGAAPKAPKALLSSLELDIVGRINAQRGARGLRSLRVSRGLTAAADYHSHQMGRFGFFEHESRNGAPFWRRIGRFYPSGRATGPWARTSSGSRPRRAAPAPCTNG